MKIPMSYLHTSETCTAAVPNTIATAASVGADVNGRAVQVTAPFSSLVNFSTLVSYLHTGTVVGFREVIHC